MTFRSNDRSRIRSDGLELKIAEPQPIGISIPDNRSGIAVPVSFSVSVTNNTTAPIPFILYDALIPEIIGPDGQKLHRTAPINKLDGGEYSGNLVGVTEQISTSVEARLFWQNNLLQLTFPPDSELEKQQINLDRSWSFDTVEPGRYQIRFIYENPTGTISYADPLTFLQTRQRTKIEVTGTSNSATEFATFSLLQPAGDRKNAVQLDGISLETFIPEPVLTVPKNSRNVRNPVQIGMRVTNNTLAPFYFSFYESFTPDLVMPDGQIQQQKGYNYDWARGPKESDFLLVAPGKSVTFFPEIALSLTQRGTFSLLVTNTSGGWGGFDPLKPGKYQIRFKYANTIDTVHRTTPTEKSIENRPIEKVWTGRVDTPFVEFRISQP